MSEWVTQWVSEWDGAEKHFLARQIGILLSRSKSRKESGVVTASFFLFLLPKSDTAHPDCIFTRQRTEIIWAVWHLRPSSTSPAATTLSKWFEITLNSPSGSGTKVTFAANTEWTICNHVLLHLCGLNSDKPTWNAPKMLDCSFKVITQITSSEAHYADSSVTVTWHFYHACCQLWGVI